MMMLIYLSMLISSSIIFLNHPMSLGMALMMQTIIISLLSSCMFLSSWYSFIIFLVMIGGMMVLFMYMTSIASNEKFYLNKSLMLIFLTLSMIMLILNSSFDSSMETLKTENSKENISDLKLMFNKIFSKPYYLNYIFLFIYLLMTMIATIKITKFNSGHLRQLK